MKDTFSFRGSSIGIRRFDETPYFCCRDIGKVCGYKTGLPVKPEDDVKKAGSLNYISLHDLPRVFSRALGDRREVAQRLLDALQKEFVAVMPVPPTPVQAPITSSDHDAQLKYLQIEMEVDALKAEMYQQQRTVKAVQVKILERQRELESLTPRNIVSIARQVKG